MPVSHPSCGSSSSPASWGGLTTFSTFSAEVVTLLARGEYGWGLAAAGAHLAGSLALTALGIAFAHLAMARI